MKKKVLSLLLAILMTVTIVPVAVFAKDDVLSYLTYEINNGEVTITDCDTSISGEVVIPSTIDGYAVTTIGNYAFDNCKDITTLRIDGGIKILGDYAFYDCESLETLLIPDSLLEIKKYCFYKCNNLTSVYYGGNEDNWDEFIIRCGNKKVLEADIYCNGEKIDSHVDNNTDGYCDNNDCNKYLWEDIYVGDTKNVRLINSKSKFFVFTPEYTGEYRLYGELYVETDYDEDMLTDIFESDDGCAWIYDSEMNQIAYGEGGPDMRFRMKFSLKAGETYYFECNMIGIYGGTASYRVILESLISEESTTKETITDEETTTKENITDDETTTEENIFGEETTLEENMTDETITEHTTIDNSMDDENDLTESENSLISTLLNFFKNFVESLKKMLSSIVEWLR